MYLIRGIIYFFVLALVLVSSATASEKSYSINAPGKTILIKEVNEEDKHYVAVSFFEGQHRIKTNKSEGVVFAPQRKGSPWDLVGSADNLYLLIYAYSGGSHCCWSTLLYHVSSGKFLGQKIPSLGSYKIYPGKSDCIIKVSAEPTDAIEEDLAELKPFLIYCLHPSGKIDLDRSKKSLSMYYKDIDWVVEEIGGPNNITLLDARHFIQYYKKRFPNDKYIGSQLDRIERY